MGRISLLSSNLICPYCDSANTHIAARKTNHISMKCLDCGKLFRSNAVMDKRDLNEPAILISRYNIVFNAAWQEATGMKEGDYVKFAITNEGIFIHPATEMDGFLLRLKQTTGKSVVAVSADLANALRDEMGIVFNQPATFYLNEKNNQIMGIIQKSGLRNLTSTKKEHFQDSFLSVRTTGSSYLSAKLSATLNVKRGSVLYLYESGDKVYLLNAEGQQGAFDPQEGFRISAGGARGFTDNYNISTTQLALFLCNRYKVPTGTPFRVKTGDLVIVDNLKMVELLKVI